MIEGTAAAWVDALTFNRVWGQERDAPRIREGFRKLCSVCADWPLPADLVRNLPEVQTYPALPAKVVSDEVAQQNIAKIKAMLSESLCPVPDTYE